PTASCPATSWCLSRSTRACRPCSRHPSLGWPRASRSWPTCSCSRTPSAPGHKGESMSLYQRLQEAQNGSTGGTSRRDPVLNELRQKIHHHLIEELGPVLYDRRLSEDELRRRVQEQLAAALLKANAPLSASDKAQLLQDVSDDVLGYGP